MEKQFGTATISSADFDERINNIDALISVSRNKGSAELDRIIKYLAEIVLLHIPEDSTIHYSEDTFLVSYFPKVPLVIHIFYECNAEDSPFMLQTFAPKATCEKFKTTASMKPKMDEVLKHFRTS